MASAQQAHRVHAPSLDVSTYHLAMHVASDYHGMLIALPTPAWHTWADAGPERVADYLLKLTRYITPRSVATAKPGPKNDKPKNYVDAARDRAHVSTDPLLKRARAKTP